MRNNTTFFERMMELAETKGIKNVQKLSEFMNYKSPEKLYRLERDKNAKPSFQVLLDLSNYFENIDLNYLVIGKRVKYTTDIEETLHVAEQGKEYNKIELLKEVFGLNDETISKKLDLIIINQGQIADRLDRGILKDVLSQEKKQLKIKKESNP